MAAAPCPAAAAAAEGAASAPRLSLAQLVRRTHALLGNGALLKKGKKGHTLSAMPEVMALMR